MTEREIIIAHRLEKAATVLNEAKTIAGLNMWLLTTNRLYYACYHAVSALFYHYSLLAKSHKGLIHLFHKEFVLTGKFAKADVELISKLFSLRTDADYADAIEIEMEEIQQIIPMVELFLEKIKTHIQTS